MTDTTRSSPQTDTQTAILDAAQRITQRDGARKLTIDAVVTESGFSKGGVLYHYPNKQALLTALVRRHVKRFEDELKSVRDTASPEKATFQTLLICALTERNPEKKQLANALLAAIAEQPELLDPAREMVKRIDAEFVDNAKDPVLAQIVLLAANGLNHRELLSFPMPDDPMLEDIRARLESMTKDLF
ncbi:TetR/AcrR family transcriptional regulator [Hyphobacterium sp.]|uniref:TetR/AcrR family transcriptional regulator n=1 Tax=Hyphobacterium sp. TaxID=2004662 RepID=UPI003B51C605